MRQLIPLLVLLCACQKQEKLLPAKELATNSTSNCDIQSGPGYYKTYNSDGSVDSLSTYTYPISPWEFHGKVQYDSNHAYLVSCHDTMFTVKFNSQHQVIETSYKDLGIASYTYNTAGQLTRITRDTSSTDDILFYYDTYGNIIQIAAAVNQTAQINFTHDYSKPIAASDYQVVPWHSVWTDFLLCQQLNFVDGKPHHKVIHSTGNLYPYFDRYYNDQVIDAQGNVLSYRSSGYSGDGDYLYSFTLHCF